VQKLWYKGENVHKYVFCKYVLINIEKKKKLSGICCPCFNNKFIDMLHYTGVLELLLYLHQFYCPYDNQWIRK